jgi:LPS-assembly lipoprotein
MQALFRTFTDPDFDVFDQQPERDIGSKTMKGSLKLCLLLLTISISSCGFALRGSIDLPADMRDLYLQAQDEGGDFTREMRRALANNGIGVVSSPEAHHYRLGIGLERSQERVLSMNANARAGEYELSMSVPFQLSNASNVLLGPEVVSTQKVYLTDPENAVAKAEESELIKREMRRELAQQILRRLQSTAAELP